MVKVAKENYFIFKLIKMMEYVQLYEELGKGLDWDEELQLKGRPKVTFIHIVDDNDERNLLAFAEWGWKGDEISFGKVQVAKPLRGHGIGDTLMSMFLAIARFYKASKITGVIDGEEFLPNWYKKLGFTVDNGNQLLMELEYS